MSGPEPDPVEGERGLDWYKAELARKVGAEDFVRMDEARAVIARAILDRDVAKLTELRQQARGYEAYFRACFSVREDARGRANECGEVKVRAERGLGQIDTVVNPRGRPPKDSDTESFTVGVSRETRANWRKLAEVPDADFEAYLADARADQESGVSTARILRGNHRPFVGHNSGWYEWWTPAAILDAAREVLGGIDLDPATSAEANEYVRAARYYTEAESGLDPEHPWAGTVFLNPPYCHPEIDQYSARLCSEWDAGNLTAAVLLVNNGTDTAWFQEVFARSAALCLVRGRMGGEGGFWHPDRGYADPLQGQAILYLGAAPAVFAREFARFGGIASTVPPPDRVTLCAHYPRRRRPRWPTRAPSGQPR